MDRLIIQGGKALRGRAVVQGSKNAALPILAATVLTPDEFELSNVPELADIETMSEILRSLGGTVLREGKTLKVNSRAMNSTRIHEDAMTKMRSSLFLCGPMLSRFGEVSARLPGGCAIGERKIDMHLDGFRAMGARVEWHEDCFRLIAPPGGLRAAHIKLRFPSVGATENIMLAAVQANGETVIENAAREPEIEDLARCLIQMGAQICGAGSKRIVIRGVSVLNGFVHRVMPDRIAAGTWILASVLTKGELLLEDVRVEHLRPLLHVLQQCGVEHENLRDHTIHLKISERWSAIERIVTAPYPAFPTDLQAPMATFLAFATGKSQLRETVFEHRFQHLLQLNKMGAAIDVHGKDATIFGVRKLYGTTVQASDLRAGAALILAGLAATGQTIIENVHHIDRGYERIEHFLTELNANVFRSKEKLSYINT